MVEVDVRELDAVEEHSVLNYATVSIQHRIGHRNELLAFDIQDFDNSYWRRVHDQWPFECTAEQLQNSRDIPLRGILCKNSSYYRNLSDKPHSLAEFDEQSFTQLNDVLKAETEKLVIFRGQLLKQMEEPTWLVTAIAGHEPGVLVQPFIGTPQIKPNAAFFAADQRELAEEYADRLAVSLNLDRYPTKGGIRPGEFFGSSFDQASFAENHLINLYERVVFTLHGDVPDSILSRAAELKLVNDTKQKAMEAILIHQDLKADNWGGPAVEAFMAIADSSSRLVSFLNEKYEPSPDDLSALDEHLLGNSRS